MNDTGSVGAADGARGDRRPLGQTGKVLRVGLVVGVLAVLVGVLAARATALPLTDPMALGDLILQVLGPRPYAQPVPGALHLVYLGALGTLCAVGAHAGTTVQPPGPGPVFLAGLVAGGMNALATAPLAATGGGLTGLLLFAPLALLSTAAAGLFASLASLVVRSVIGKQRR